MLLRMHIAIAMFFGLIALPTHADVRELDRSELRANVQAGKSMSLANLLNVIHRKAEGEVVDVRGFEDGDVYYRVLIKTPEGRIAAAIVRADNGRFVSGKTNVAREIMSAAKAKQRRASTAKDRAREPRESSESDEDGNSGSNGNGNSGGNGNGN